VKLAWFCLTTVVLFGTCLISWSQAKRKIIIDQDAAGPGGTDQQSILMLIQSPQTEILGIIVVTGDAWLHEEVAHTLLMLELIGRTDSPVVPRAEYPLVRRKEMRPDANSISGSIQKQPTSFCVRAGKELPAQQSIFL